jgi:EF-P beta-lysylation protein EpmB
MITNLEKLTKKLDLKLPKLKDSKIFTDFPLLAPENFVKNIKPGDPKNPLLLQILPQNCELLKKSGYTEDPLYEEKNSPVSGLIHKYHGRVLLLATDVCAINCRFCFRRCIKDRAPKIRSGSIYWKPAFSYIKNDKSITEVILSGGDPLMLPSDKLKWLMDQIAKIPHVKRIRIHSRVPIVMPELIKVNTIKSKLPVVLVVHCNHPNEINSKVVKCIKLLTQQNITVFNQAVLLRNINDCSRILTSLSEKLFNVGIIPYYLHILDKVKGAAHFYVGSKKAKEIYRKLQKILPGYMVPKLVVEIKNRKHYLI